MAQLTKDQYPVDAFGHLGDYNSQVCVGGFKPTLKDLYRTKSPHGLSFLTSYLLWMVRDEEEGVYAYQRLIHSQSLTTTMLWYRPPGENAMIHPESNNFVRGMCSNLLRKDHIRVRSLPGALGPAFTLKISPDDFHCVEEDKIELAGKGFGLAANAYYPHEGQDLLYIVRYYDAEGTHFGKKVNGCARWIQVYGPSGETWDTTRIFREVQEAWIAGFNFYENGEKEMYLLAYGKGDFGWLFASSGDKITAISRSVKAEVELDDDQNLRRALYRSPDAGDWEWSVDCQLVNPISAKMPIKWALGPTRRVGETRKSSFNVGWMEYFPSHI